MKKKHQPIFSLSVFLIVMIHACQPAPSEQGIKSAGQSRFSTTPPSHLYFKNIRSTFYELTTQPGTRIDLYRYRRFSQTTDRPILYPLIVDNWMEDEAYLAIRPNDYEGGFSDTLQVFWSASDSSGVYRLESARWEDQYRLAMQLDESLKQRHKLEIRTSEGRIVPIFETRGDRDHFQTTIRDFQRLTEAR